MEVNSADDVFSELKSIFQRSFVKMTQNMSFPSVASIFIPICWLGLANRLRMLTGVLTIAQRYNMHVVAAWHRDGACNASFHSVLSISGDLRDMMTVIDVASPCIPDSEYRGALLSMGRDYLEPNGASWLFYSPSRFLVDPDHFHGHNVVFMLTRTVHAFTDSSCEDYLALKRWFYSCLEPGPSVRPLLQQLESSHAHFMTPAPTGTISIGVHLRIFEESFDWAMVAPRHEATKAEVTISSGAHGEESLHYVRSSSLAQVVKRAETFDREVPDAIARTIRNAVNSLRLLHGDKQVQVFVASNSVQAKEKLVHDFGEESVLILLPSDPLLLSRNSPYAVSLAVAEFFLLSKSSIIFHSHASSFAREAAAVRTVPLVDFASLRDAPPLLFVTMAPTMPMCALPEFIRVQNSLSSVTTALIKDRQCYWEDGGREMCSLRYFVCPCQDNVVFEAIGALCPVPFTSSPLAAIDSSCRVVTAESTGHSI